MDSFSFKTLRTALFVLLFSGVFFAVISQFTSIDVNIEDYYYDAQIHQFIWKNSWFAKQLMHTYVKDVIIVLALLLIIVVVVDIGKPISKISAWTRIRLRFVSVAAIVIPSFISSAKQLSVMHCPWDVERYGGAVPYLRLFDMMPAHIEAGHCFPAGHASTGLWLAAFCVFWLPYHPRKALLVFLAGLGVGFVLGWVQQMRGAHFLSHTLWSVWIASAIILFMLCVSQSFINRH